MRFCCAQNNIPFTKERVFFNTLEIAEPGYLFVYLSYENESDNWVYFDDFKITHTKTNIVQYNDYYPYGLQANTSWTREDSGNNRLYNQGNELNPSTGWYETFFRGYDPAIGRFTGVDPLASKFPSLSGYHYAYNNPVMFNDPLGAQGEPGNPWFSGGYRWMDYSGPPPSAYNSMGASTFGSTMDNYWGQAMSGNNWAEQTMYRNELASQARGGDMGAVREYAARYGGGLMPVEVWHSTAQAGGETYYHYEVVANGVNAQNGAQGGGNVYSGDNILGATYSHFQFGGGDPLYVNTSSLNFSNVSYKNLKPLGNGRYGLNLYSVDPYNQTSLALGKITLVSQGNNQYSIEPDYYDFNIEWDQGFSKRNIATFGAGLLHYGVNPVAPLYPVVPLIFGGPYWIHFQGNVYIKP